MLRRSSFVVEGVACLALLCTGLAFGKTTPQQTCEAGKNKQLGVYASCLQTAEHNFVLNGDATKYETAITKCETTLQTQWQKLENAAVKAKTSCLTTGDESAVQGAVTDLTSCLSGNLAGETPATCDPTTLQSDLGTCNASLNTCNSNDATCTTNLGTCNASLNTCNSNDATCTTNLGTCTGSLTTVNAGTATATDVLSGATFSSSAGLGLTGTAPAGSNVNGPNGAKTFPIPAGIYLCNVPHGSGCKAATANDTNLVASNIVTGVNIFGVTGTQPPAQPLRTGQTQCDQGTGTLGACPGSLAGQDGALLKGATRLYTEPSPPDGTITDNKTGLMWEKLSNDGSIHDYTNYYTWYTAFTTKIATLNTMNSGAGFANHTDWRLPNVNELQSIANYGTFNPAVDAVFNTSCAASCTVTTCSCTQSTEYWSSTTYQGFPGFAPPPSAWSVFFSDGTVSFIYKSSNLSVRAVRGG